MTAVLDVDLLAETNPLRPSFQPTLVLVWAGKRVLGTTEVPPILPGGAHEAKAALSARFGGQVLAAAELPPPTPSVSPHSAADVTIVVSTRDQPRLLHRCLTSLAELDPAPAEIIVVDRGNATDPTVQAADATARRIAASGAGWAAARNVGWAAAQTDLVAFVADDARAHPTFAGAVAGAFIVPEVAAVIGLAAPAELQTRPQRLFEVLSGLNRGYTRQVYGAGAWASALRLDRRGTGVNMAFRRHVLVELDGFDEQFDIEDTARPASRSAADLDMLLRALRHGSSVVYDPDAVVRRTSPRDWITFLGEMADNGFSYASVLAKYEREPLEVAVAARQERSRWHRRDHVRAVLGAVARRKLWTAAVLLAEIAGSRRSRRHADPSARVGS